MVLLEGKEGNYLFSSQKPDGKTCVLSLCQKGIKEGVILNSSGREFQNCVANTEKACP